MDEENRRTLSETYECPSVSVDGAELRGVIAFPPAARLEADLGGSTACSIESCDGLVMPPVREPFKGANCTRDR